MHSVSSLYPVLVLISLAVLSTRPDAGPLTRDQAVAIAVDSNPAVVAALAQWQVARFRKLVALAPEDPELELEYAELPGVFDTNQFGERNIGISQRIESPVKWWLRWRAAGQEAESVRYSAYEATRLEVGADARVGFDRVLADREIVAASKEGLQLARDLATKARIRFEAGDVARLEVMRSEVQVGLAENAVADAVARLVASEASLAVVLGRNGSAPIEIAGELSMDHMSYELETLKRRTIDRRPDLQGAHHSLSGARLSRSKTIAALVPDLNLGVSRQTIGGPGSRSSFWRATFGIQIPLWAPFRQRGEISASDAQVRQAEADFEALEQRALGEVVSSHAALEAARSRAEVFESGVLKLAAAAREAASESYRQGKATYLEVLEAQRTLTDARIGYTEALYDYRRAHAELERATGGSL